MLVRRALYHRRDAETNPPAELVELGMRLSGFVIRLFQVRVDLLELEVGLSELAVRLSEPGGRL
jgi:hypothetical protein